MTVWEPIWTATTSICTRAESKGSPKGSYDVLRAAIFVAVLLCMCVLGLSFEESRLPSSSIQHSTVEQSKFGKSISRNLTPQKSEAEYGEFRNFHDSPPGNSIRIRPTSTSPEPSNSPNRPSLVAKNDSEKTTSSLSSFSLSDNYLFWHPIKYDLEAGLNHRLHSLGCALGEAAFLNRTYLFDSNFRVDPLHNFGRGKVNDVRLYVDTELLQSQVRLVDKSSFSKSWASYKESYPNSYQNSESTNETKTETLNLTRIERWVDWNESATTLVDVEDFYLQRPKPRPKFFLYTRCYEEPLLNKGLYMESNNTVYRPIQVPYSRLLLDVVRAIQRRLGEYDAVHIRRGDFLRYEEIFPTLDNDTRPAALLETLPKWISPNRTIHIATNEYETGFFDPLKVMYNVSLLSDHADLWANGSEWWHAAQEYGRDGEEVEFDGMMMGVVDYTLTKEARTTVETFGFLTPEHDVAKDEMLKKTKVDEEKARKKRRERKGKVASKQWRR